MSDGLTQDPTRDTIGSPTESTRTARPSRVVVPLQALVTVVVLAGAGALGGILWRHLWDAPTGVVSDHTWFTDETGLRADFAATGWYVAVAGLGGLLLGAVLAWVCDRSELVTLAATLVGSLLAAYLMLQVGHHLSPPDPDTLAKTAADGTKLEGQLRIHRQSPLLASPFGALLGLMVVYFLTSSRADRVAYRQARREARAVGPAPAPTSTPAPAPAPASGAWTPPAPGPGPAPGEVRTSPPPPG